MRKIKNKQKIMFKKIFFLISFFLFTNTFASSKVFEPESNFWFYFFVVLILLWSWIYFYFKSKFLSLDKQIAISFLVILISFIISYFLDSDYKKTQIEQYKLTQIKSEVSNKTKYAIERRRREILQKKIEELETENNKLKSLEKNIKSNINTKENIIKSREIRQKIAKLEDDLLLIDTKINQINRGDYKDDLFSNDDEEFNKYKKNFSVIEKIKQRKKSQKFSLDWKNINSILENDIEKRKQKNKIQIISSTKNSKKEEKQEKLSKQEEFLKNHYKLLEEKKIEQAYLETPKKVSYIDYKNWYKNVEKIVINKIKKQKENVYLVDLDIFEKNSWNNYVVEKTLKKDKKNKKFKIIKKKTISTKKIEKKENFDINSLAISSLEFKKILKNPKKYQVVDLREWLENSAWKVKNSIHIRLEDLKLVSYEKLDKKKIIILYDWDSKKSIIATKFLKKLWFNVKFLKWWLKNLNISPVFFSWTKNFFEKYKKDNYKKIFDDKSLEKILNLWWVYLVDVRKIEKFKQRKIKGSVNIPLTYLPKTKWDFYIKKIPEKSKIITICDDNESCFYAKIVWIEMEKRLYKFLWTYKLKNK